jgi:hypothetical protein
MVVVVNVNYIVFANQLVRVNNGGQEGNRPDPSWVSSMLGMCKLPCALTALLGYL